MARIVRRDVEPDGVGDVAYWRWRISMTPEEYTAWWWSDVGGAPDGEGGQVSFEVARRRR